jgi:hypothetical protein
MLSVIVLFVNSATGFDSISSPVGISVLWARCQWGVQKDISTHFVLRYALNNYIYVMAFNGK